MSLSRSLRQGAIADLIRSGRLASQEEVVEKLAARGFTVTQATVSRDLDQLGAVKLRRKGAVAYALPDDIAPREAAAPRLAAVLNEFARSVECAGNLVVIRTPPGSAHLVGVTLDQAELPDVVGTICGDDTIFVAVKSARDARALADSFRSPPHP